MAYDRLGDNAVKRLLVLVFLLSAPALAGDRTISNPDPNGDLKVKVNRGGTDFTALTISGTTGRAQIAGEAPGGLVPAGSVMMFAGASAPAGWMLAWGQLITCSGNCSADPENSALFAAISNTYGGNGTTTFSLPDCQGRVIAGKDNMSGTPAGRLTALGSGITGTTLGATGGVQNTLLTSLHIPQHGHSIDHDHASADTGATSLSLSATVASAGHRHGIAHTHAVAYANSALGSTASLFYMRPTSDTSSTTVGAASVVFGAQSVSGAGTAVPIYQTHNQDFFSSGVVSAPSGSGSSALSDTPTSTTALSLSGANAVTGVDLPNFTGSSGDYGAASPTAVAAVQPTIVMNCIIKI